LSRFLGPESSNEKVLHKSTKHWAVNYLQYKYVTTQLHESSLLPFDERLRTVTSTTTTT